MINEQIRDKEVRLMKTKSMQRENFSQGDRVKDGAQLGIVSRESSRKAFASVKHQAEEDFIILEQHQNVSKTGTIKNILTKKFVKIA